MNYVVDSNVLLRAVQRKHRCAVTYLTEEQERE
jgi:hypothetical protein